MSPGRKGTRSKQPTPEPAPLQVHSPEPLQASESCDCGACAGEELEPEELVEELLEGVAELVDSDEPLEAELMAATLIAIGSMAGETFEQEVLVPGFIPIFEARATDGAMAMLLAIGAVATGPAAGAAQAAADRLAAAGVPPPRWAAQIGQPVTVGDCVRLADPIGVASALVGAFHRAGRSHALVATVDYLDGGAASELFLFPAEHLPEVLAELRTGLHASGLEVTEQRLDPADFRWQVQSALEARAARDGDLSDEDLEEAMTDPEGGPGYLVIAALARARMSVLPASGKPLPVHDRDTDHGTGEQLPALPAARATSGAPAPVYQLKVSLRGAKPPIWRRLEVPADISLASLHDVVQVAFGWDDSHLHVFDTPYGFFGRTDPELGHAAEERATLEQVAPGEKRKLVYTYDFGDSWTHEIVVEAVRERDPSGSYPRCTGGRRAAPPEDCGGVWGYAELMEVLADPAHPEHKDRLGWLGLDDPAGLDPARFDPARFDPAEVSRALASLPVG